MGLPIKSLSFSAFVRRWAGELNRDPIEVAESVASAISGRELAVRILDPSYPGINHHGNPLFEDNPHAENFIIDISDHLARVGKGIELPDLDDRLRYVSLEWSSIQTWLSSEGIAVPSFLSAVPAGENADVGPAGIEIPPPGWVAYRNLQKVVAILVLVLAKRASKYNKSDGTINVLQVQQAILELLEGDADLQESLGKKGLAPSSISQQITEALKILEKTG